jgi:hypothetical protein
MANTGLRQCTFSMQKDEFVFRKSYGIDDISFLAIAPDIGRESHSCFCQVPDRSGQVIRSRHIASYYGSLLPPPGTTALSWKAIFQTSAVCVLGLDPDRCQ